MTTPAQNATARPLPQRIAVLSIDAIEPHPGNIREDLGDLAELARSIQQQGILQPLLVQPHPDKEGKYRLLAGHRRFDAAQLAGLTRVPAVIRDGVDDNQALELMLVENCQRRELGPMERAEALGSLINRGYSQSQIARQTGMSVSWVNYYLSLLALDDAGREQVRTGRLTVTAAIKAVRSTREKARKSGGQGTDFRWEPDHFTDQHALARAARKLCGARGHTMRRRIGDIACGQCWETVIRQDEAVVQRAAQNLQNGAAQQ